MTKDFVQESRRLNLALLTVFVGTLVVFVVSVTGSFHRLAAPIVSDFGNASAPYSDAMDPWLRGAVGYYVHDVPQVNLYRPTVGLFFSSVLSLFQSVRAIPVTFIIIFLVSLSWLYTWGTIHMRLIVTGALLMMTLNYNDSVSLLNPECVTVDFWAMSFSVTGLFLIALAAGRATKLWLPAAAGFALLGVVAAIRGPQLLGGFLVLGWCMIRWIRKREWKAVVLSAIFFITPSVVDNSIRSGYHVTNNAIQSLYSVYIDPSHGWTPASSRRYTEEKPSNSEVIKGYVAFMGTESGRAFINWAMSFAPAHDAMMIKRPRTFAVLALCAVLGWLIHRQRRDIVCPALVIGVESSIYQIWAFRIGIIFTVLIAWKILHGDSFGFFHPVLWLALAIAVAGTAARRPIAVCFALCYIGSVILHSAFGLPGAHRVSATYKIFILISITSFLIERSSTAEVNESTRRSLTWLSCSILVVIALAYAGNFVLRRDQKDILRTQLAKPNHLLKVSANRDLDRSLYMTGGLMYFYTTFDSLPFGSIRSFKSMNAPGGLYHASFLNPCLVIWEDGKP